MPPLASLVRGHKNPFLKDDVLTGWDVLFSATYSGFKTVSEQYGTLRRKTSRCEFVKGIPEGGPDRRS
jgi:hypothetical protein